MFGKKTTANRQFTIFFLFTSTHTVEPFLKGLGLWVGFQQCAPSPPPPTPALSLSLSLSLARSLARSLALFVILFNRIVLLQFVFISVISFVIVIMTYNSHITWPPTGGLISVFRCHPANCNCRRKEKSFWYSTIYTVESNISFPSVSRTGFLIFLWTSSASENRLTASGKS